MPRLDNYSVIYWAAACLVHWAGYGVSDGQFVSAMDMICRDANMSVVQEAQFRRIVGDMMKGGDNGDAR